MLKKPVANMVYAALMAGLMVAAQVALASLPNVELVSFLVIVFTLFRPLQARAAIGVFVLLQGLMYGFSLWWFSYLYIWYILHFVVLFLKNKGSPLMYALVSACFGLLFGSLTAIPTFFLAGPAAAFAYILNGLYFDALHCGGNFVVCFALYKPVMLALSKVKSLATLQGGKQAK